MTLGISAWAIRNPIPVAVLFIALIAAGIGSFFILPVKAMPDTSFAMVQVTISQSGSAPAELESQVTRLAENAVAGLPGVKYVMSTVTQGQSRTTVEFEIGEDPQKAADQVRTAIDRIRANLPRTIDEPIIEAQEADNEPILTYAVSEPSMSDADLSWYIDDTLTARLQALGGIAGIARVGGVDREVNVTLYPARAGLIVASLPSDPSCLDQPDLRSGRNDGGAAPHSWRRRARRAQFGSYARRWARALRPLAPAHADVTRRSLRRATGRKPDRGSVRTGPSPRRRDAARRPLRS